MFSVKSRNTDTTVCREERMLCSLCCTVLEISHLTESQGQAETGATSQPIQGQVFPGKSEFSYGNENQRSLGGSTSKG